MEENKQSTGDFYEEFRNLGQNLKNVINTAWESEERKKIQEDIQDGLNELGSAISNLFDDIQTSEVGKKVVKEVDEFGERLRSGEVKEKTRSGVLSALQKMNAELENAISKFTTGEEK